MKKELNGMKNKLKPCPFCGSEQMEVGGTLYHGEYRVFVRCLDCPAEVYSRFNSNYLLAEEEAVAAWNRREDIVDCKDCEHYDSKWKNGTGGRGYCLVINDVVDKDNWCMYGERKEGEE